METKFSSSFTEKLVLQTYTENMLNLKNNLRNWKWIYIYDNKILVDKIIEIIDK